LYFEKNFNSMRLRLMNMFLLVAMGGMLTFSCKKSDPAPLGAQVNAVLLAGEKGQSKGWKLREFNYDFGGSNKGTASFAGCFTDNVYTFTNNDSQDYAATEGASPCGSGAPNQIEAGTWAFTLDGLTINIEVDNTASANGLFSAEAILNFSADGQSVTGASSAGLTPYPAFVKKIDANNLVLEVNGQAGSDTFKYTLTFTPA
jgi:hypothetical protein